MWVSYSSFLHLSACNFYNLNVCLQNCVLETQSPMQRAPGRAPGRWLLFSLGLSALHATEWCGRKAPGAGNPIWDFPAPRAVRNKSFFINGPLWYSVIYPKMSYDNNHHANWGGRPRRNVEASISVLLQSGDNERGRSRILEILTLQRKTPKTQSQCLWILMSCSLFPRKQTHNVRA